MSTRAERLATGWLLFTALFALAGAGCNSIAGLGDLRFGTGGEPATGTGGTSGVEGTGGTGGTGGMPGSCTDGVKDGDETDVDCGGGCPGCAVGKACATTADCMAGEGCDTTTKTCDGTTCADGVKDGDETDVDCGGGTCPTCGVGQECSTSSDCQAGEGCDTTTKHCEAGTCKDGVKDGNETDVDCGGACPGCGIGKACATTGDCQAGEGCDTTTKTCLSTTCTDGEKDGTETDVDCGGGACPGCGIGKACAVTSDCEAGEGCDLTNKTCDGNTCNDGLQNGGETDVDCGGGACPSCAVGKKCMSTGDCMAGNGCDVTTKVCDANLCHDGAQDGGETDVDCGGGTCAGCVVGKKCNSTSDCAAGAGCDLGTKTCNSSQCHDGLQDGSETDVDCGGPTCAACGVGQKCNATGDCGSGEGCDVVTKTCDANTCNDGAKDGNETDVDCGGPCAGCLVGKKCNATTDCKAGEGCDVLTKTCDANLCNDGVKDGAETDVDCGGACPGCGIGKKCGSTGDCLAGEGCDVVTKTCDANLCDDGVKDGAETDVDCGGGTCLGCGVNRACLSTSDCLAGEGCDLVTKTCDGNTCNDGLEDSSETDVDCGGGTCGGCAVGKKCLTTGDCLAGEGCDKTTKRCDANTCNDGAKDGSETDVDCGGTCGGCAVGKTCVTTSDCLAGEGCDLVTKTCDANTCNDGVKDGGETDIDCGGGTCGGCAVGKSCSTNGDCQTGDGCDKATKRCDANLCNDGVKDGAETDVDCGGTCGQCAVGQACAVATDCSSGNCHVGVCAPTCVDTVFGATGGVQQINLPSTGTYTIEITGAQGGPDSYGHAGGLGALIRGNFNRTAGDLLQMVVGVRPGGPAGGDDGGGGGGGSFVWLGPVSPLPSFPLIAAGGGGGGGGGAGLIITSGGNGDAAGGTNGSGGSADQTSFLYSGGGGTGWLSGGQTGSSPTNAGGGGQWNGGAGTDYGGDKTSAGGFGGGGGAGEFNHGSGGGGGFSGGGGGGQTKPDAGGGGSYIDAGATVVTKTGAYQSGSGYVKIIGPLSSTCP